MLAGSSHRDDRWRLFFAWRPSADIRQDILGWIAAAGHPDWVRWVRPDNLHVTLYFVGNTIPDDVEKVKKQAAKTLTGLKEFTLRSNRLEFRGKPGRASMIWLSFFNEQAFTNLHNALRAAVSGIVTPQTDFKDPVPHITIARMGRRFRNESVSLPLDFTKYDARVGTIELWRSEKDGSGVRYSSIAAWSLSEVSEGLSDSP